MTRSEGCGKDVLCLTLGFSLGVVIAVGVGVHPTAPNTLHFVESRLGILDFLFKWSRFCLLNLLLSLLEGFERWPKYLNVWDGAVRALLPGGGAPIL